MSSMIQYFQICLSSILFLFAAECGNFAIGSRTRHLPQILKSGCPWASTSPFPHPLASALRLPPTHPGSLDVLYEWPPKLLASTAALESFYFFRKCLVPPLLLEMFQKFQTGFEDP